MTRDHAKPGEGKPKGKTRILVISDLHLDTSPSWRMPDDVTDHDVAVVAGDLTRNVADSIRWLADQRTLAGRPVVFVPGNHEFYDSKPIDDQIVAGHRACGGTNVTLLSRSHTRRGTNADPLNRTHARIAGLRFVGATLWTDHAINGNAVLGAMMANQWIKDHKWARLREGATIRPFTAWDAIERHGKDLERLHGVAAGGSHREPLVVISHHAPSARSIGERYRDAPINVAYASNLDRMIEEDAPALWIHGHVHTSCDYAIGRTRILCNPKGHGPKNPGGPVENPDFDPALVIEL